MSHATPAAEVRQLVLVPLMRDAWRLCDRTVATSDADNLIAYVESVDDDAYEVVWVAGGGGVETFSRLEDILRAAFEMISRADENDDVRAASLSLVPSPVPDRATEAAR